MLGEELHNQFLSLLGDETRMAIPVVSSGQECPDPACKGCSLLHTFMQRRNKRPQILEAEIDPGDGALADFISSAPGPTGRGSGSGMEITTEKEPQEARKQIVVDVVSDPN